MDVLLFCKSDEFSLRAIQIARVVFGERLHPVAGRTGDPLPSEALAPHAGIVLSFLSPWIIPKALLDSAQLALNWHPASVDYPGIGCYNFALYDEAAEYGATCHFMAEKVDTGGIVEERRFPVFASDTVETLKLRTLVTMSAMFHETICKLATGWTPGLAGLGWSRRPYTRRELDALTTIESGMSSDEIRRRVRATTYPGYPGASMVIGGERFAFPVPDREPLA